MGVVCQQFGNRFYRSRGMYFSVQDRGQFGSMVYNWPHDGTTNQHISSFGRVIMKNAIVRCACDCGDGWFTYSRLGKSAYFLVFTFSFSSSFASMLMPLLLILSLLLG